MRVYSKKYNLLKIVLKERQKERKRKLVITNDAVYEDFFFHVIHSIERLTFYHVHPRTDRIIHLCICMNIHVERKKKEI